MELDEVGVTVGRAKSKLVMSNPESRESREELGATARLGVPWGTPTSLPSRELGWGGGGGGGGVVLGHVQVRTSGGWGPKASVVQSTLLLYPTGETEVPLASPSGFGPFPVFWPSRPDGGAASIIWGGGPASWGWPWVGVEGNSIILSDGRTDGIIG